jgi:hypothetical protein
MPNDNYIAGLDILGLAPATKPVIVARKPPAAAATKPTATAAKATAAAKPAAAKAVSAAVKKSIQTRAASSAKHANTTADKLGKRKQPVAKSMSKMLKSHASRLVSAATKIKGVAEIFGDDAVVDAVTQSVSGVDRMAQAGDIANQLLPVIDQLYAAGKSDLAHDGETMVNAANYIVTSIDQMIRNVRMM